jgi:hypothetical protein
MAEDIPQGGSEAEATGRPLLLVLAWLWVAVPFAWGVYELALTARKLFM